MANCDWPGQPDSGTDHKFSAGRPHTSPDLLKSAASFSPELVPTRQQRLLQGRNARFLAKKLSISSINNKLTGLVHNVGEAETHPHRDQENILHKSKSAGTLGKRLTSSQSLTILGEISNSSRYRSLRKKSDISILQDNIERPLLDNSPFSSPQPCNISSSETVSPVPFDNIHDSLTDMRSNQISTHGWASSAHQMCPATCSKPKTRRSGQSKYKFDADEYIEHIERELLQVKEDAYSPRTKRPLKEKVKQISAENERLQEELSFLREKFETEVKRALEHNTNIEFDLRRKVKDLEDKLEAKEQLIEELQYQHEEKRLDSNIIESLKSTIDRLEMERRVVESENVNVTKRNDVLTQLLAMSPTKMQITDPSSPVRDKRSCRPLSMIFPRMPSSPETRSANSDLSNMNSPEPEILDYFGAQVSTPSTELKTKPNHSTIPDGLGIDNLSLQDDVPSNTEMGSSSRRWTFHPDMAVVPASAPVGQLSPSEENRRVSKRKPRKFLRGSNQLKPLLLPALTESGMPSASSTMSSPGSTRLRSSSDLSMETLASVIHHTENMSNLLEESVADADSTPASGPGPAYFYGEDVDIDNTLMPTVSETAGSGVDCFTQTYDRDVMDLTNTVSGECFVQRYPQRETNRPLGSDSADLFSNHFRALGNRMLSASQCSSSPNFTPTMPEPLFSPMRVQVIPGTGSQGLYQNHLTSSIQSDAFILRSRRQSDASVVGIVDSPTAKLPRKRPLSSSFSPLPPMPSSQTTQPSHQASSTGHNLTRRSMYNPHESSHTVSPFDLFKCKDFQARTAASLGIRTVYGLLATCTSVIRQAKRNPYALAKRILAGAWHANWAAMGKASWWVLGLFIDAGQRAETRNSFSWQDYDGDDIAQRICASPDSECTDTSLKYDLSPSLEQLNEGPPDLQNSNTLAKAEEQTRGGWSRSLFLWGKFSVAIMLAIGGAVTNGPAEALQQFEPRDEKLDGSPLSDRQRHVYNHRSRTVLECGKSMSLDQDTMNQLRQRRISNTSPERSEYMSTGSTLQFFSYSPQSDILRSAGSINRTLRPPLAPRPGAKEFFSDARGLACQSIDCTTGSTYRPSSHPEVFDNSLNNG